MIIDPLEFTSMIHTLQSEVDSVIVAIENRLVLSTQGESIEMSPATLGAIKQVLGLQSNVIRRLFEENSQILDHISALMRDHEERQNDTYGRDGLGSE